MPTEQQYAEFGRRLVTEADVSYEGNLIGSRIQQLALATGVLVLEEGGETVVLSPDSPDVQNVETETVSNQALLDVMAALPLVYPSTPADPSELPKGLAAEQTYGYRGEAKIPAGVIAKERVMSFIERAKESELDRLQDQERHIHIWLRELTGWFFGLIRVSRVRKELAAILHNEDETDDA